MPTYNIRGVEVDFPFQAYDCQLVYMEKVIQSLQEKSNALLESPTGTGKTLCLLCATLAWRKSLGSFTSGISIRSSQNEGGKEEKLSQFKADELPTIIYASRTHSQIRQVIQELKRTSYRPKMVVLGSREQLCIHDDVKLLHGRAQTNACHLLRKRRDKNYSNYCNRHQRATDYLRKNPHLGEEPMDIEDLVNIGKKFGPCPYYVSRELHKVVDIAFAPYNYLIDRGYRKSLQFQWESSVLIFDEAHNLESLCADAASFDLPSRLLTACISEAKECVDACVKRRESLNENSCKPEDFAILRALLLKLEKRIAEVPIPSKELGLTKPGPYMYELMADLNITNKTFHKVINIIEEATLLIEGLNEKKPNNNVCRLETFLDIINIIFRGGETHHAKFYCVHLQEDEPRATDSKKGKPSRTLSWWCFNPGVAMEAFPRMGVGSIILTSGTLSPMDSFAQELKLDFPIRLENPHVISANQIWAGVVPVGPSGHLLNSSYRTRDSLEYKQDLGNAIVNLARIVPDGLLVFFPSYYLMDQCIACWKDMTNGNSTTIWERISKNKKPVIEPRQSSLFSASIEDYMSKLKETSASGAVFFAVCRGKVSEGLDFSDHAGRAVIITGLPFPTTTDAKVRLKREYLDKEARERKELQKGITGEEWYTQQASRAVNQAVGRVIRHRYDYGAIIFCDERFAHPSRQSQISQWIRPHIKCYSKFGEVVFNLTRFFRDGQILGHTKVTMLQAEKEGNLRGSPVEQHQDGSFREKFTSSQFLQTTAEVTYTKASSAGAKKDSSFNLADVVPANRSSLSFDGSQSSSSKNHGVKHIDLTRKRKPVLSRECEIIDIADECLLHEKPSNEMMRSCSSKKRIFVPGDYNISQCTENSIDHSAAEPSAQGSATLHDADCNPLNTNSELLCHVNPVALADEEARGSAFLTQVKEKLSTKEYQEFVGSMKAIKTKAMKISQALESIVNLLTGPGRVSLLSRFKDYIPAKYHSLYEQLIGKIIATPGLQNYGSSV